MKVGGIEQIPNHMIRVAEQLRIMNEERKKEREELEKDKALLMQKLDELEAKIAGGGVANNVTVVNNVVINNFNTPNMDHLYEFNTFYKLLATEGVRLPVALIFETYFDPRHPENECVHLLDDKTRRVFMRTGEKWLQYPMDKALEELRNMGYKLAADGLRRYQGNDMPQEQINAVLKHLDIIAKYRPQKYDPDAEKYDKREIEQKLIAEYPASQAHPAVVAERARMKEEIANLLPARKKC
jgi:hypothetical protein